MRFSVWKTRPKKTTFGNRFTTLTDLVSSPSIICTQQKRREQDSFDRVIRFKSRTRVRNKCYPVHTNGRHDCCLLLMDLEARTFIVWFSRNDQANVRVSVIGGRIRHTRI